MIDKGSARAKSVPARTATKPQRSPRIKAGPQVPLTARDRRAKTRTINKQVIGSKRNSGKHIKTQLEIDEATPSPTKMYNKTTHKRRDTEEQPTFTYYIPCPKSKQTPAPVT